MMQISFALLPRAQDKFLQKEHLRAHCGAAVPLPDYCAVPSLAAAAEVGERFGCGSGL